MMKRADSIEPKATSQIVARCTRRDNLSQPNSHKPRNVDSRKNAASPSIASGAPKILPTSLEYADQFIPNWNSCTRPVTTPIARLMTSRVPKNRVSRRYSGLLRRYQAVCSRAVRNASPIVTGTNRKWLTVTNANSHLARSNRMRCLLPRCAAGRQRTRLLAEAELAYGARGGGAQAA